MPSPLLRPDTLIRNALAGRVSSVFNDQDRGEKPVSRSDNAMFPAGSVIWRVHGDVTSMMVGGVTALLLQMLHPAALAGIWDHSTFRDDMLGRLRRTARFIASEVPTAAWFVDQIAMSTATASSLRLYRTAILARASAAAASSAIFLVGPRPEPSARSRR